MRRREGEEAMGNSILFRGTRNVRLGLREWKLATLQLSLPLPLCFRGGSRGFATVAPAKAMAVVTDMAAATASWGTSFELPK